MEEQKKIEQRKQNIRILGLEEDTSGTTLVEQIERKLHTELQVSIKVKDAFRIGRVEEGRPRIVIAKCEKMEGKVEAIKASRERRSKTMMITRDRTKSEWLKFKKQMEVVREARQHNKWAILDEWDNAIVREFRQPKANSNGKTGSPNNASFAHSPPRGESSAKNE
jgi:hypothetical protein